MKKVIDFKEGEHISTPLLVSSLLKGTTNSGSPYMTLVLQDDSKSIDAKLWDLRPEVEKLLEAGRIYNFDLEIIKYRNNLQAKVIKVLPVMEQELKKEDFISKSPVPKEELRQVIHDAVARIGNVKIAEIVTAMLKYYEKDFYAYPAASKIHHEFMGGLATHVSGMLKVAEALCDIYPQLSRDYLYAGVILHDLGKIEELSSPVVTEYTTEGKLLGHISIAAGRLLEIGKELGYEDSEELLVLRHMVLSHHGQYEYGSPVRPETMEAEMLNFIDNIDARMNILDKALSQVEPGTFTPKLFALDGRFFYRHH
ncbi:MAG: HD domain-containing protein [Erysipelotrichaceae bacterium]|nr:HD domain-containing protein [Erysipelotrichaceae bacterium]